MNCKIQGFIVKDDVKSTEEGRDVVIMYGENIDQISQELIQAVCHRIGVHLIFVCKESLPPTGVEQYPFWMVDGRDILNLGRALSNITH